MAFHRVPKDCFSYPDDAAFVLLSADVKDALPSSLIAEIRQGMARAVRALRLRDTSGQGSWVPQLAAEIHHPA